MSVRDTARRAERAREGKAQPLSSWLIAAGLCVAVVVCFLFTTGRMWHWFVLPVVASGILIGKDAIDWFRGRLETMDPLGLFSLFGLHFFFLAYLLHPALDFYWRYRYPPPDWRTWLGISACVNVAGLLVFRWILRFGGTFQPKTVWVIHKGKLLAAAAVTLVGTAVLQATIYRRFGGILGAAYARENRAFGGDPFEGLGWAITLAESFPIVSVIVLLVFTRNARIWRTAWAVPLLVVGSFVIALLFGGVRGSRSTIFVVLFWAVTLLHVYIRPLSRKLILVGPPLLFLFMTGYLFYKHGGVDGAMRIGDPLVLQSIEDRMGLEDAQAFILLHDFARADSQALMLYLAVTDDGFRPVLGKTIVAGLASVVPRAIWPSRPESANREKSTLMFGPGTNRHVTWIFGLAAEFLINFGPLAMPFAFIPCAAIVLLARATLVWRNNDDARLLLWPVLLYSCFMTPLGETQVLVFAWVKTGLVPFLVVASAATRQHVVGQRTGTV